MFEIAKIQTKNYLSAEELKELKKLEQVTWRCPNHQAQVLRLNKVRSYEDREKLRIGRRGQQ